MRFAAKRTVTAVTVLVTAVTCNALEGPVTSPDGVTAVTVFVTAVTCS